MNYVSFKLFDFDDKIESSEKYRTDSFTNIDRTTFITSGYRCTSVAPV